MAPHYERARMLHAAIDEATQELDAPIDRVEVAAGRVFASAGGKRVSFRYYYANGRGPDGSVMPGGGRWVVEKATPLDEPSPLKARLVARLRNFLR
jgi:hypothetical protein